MIDLPLTRKFEAFWNVKQRGKFPENPRECAKQVQELYEAAAEEDYTVKVPTLWKMERLGVWAAKENTGDIYSVRGRTDTRTHPILLVGMGAGCVAYGGLNWAARWLAELAEPWQQEHFAEGIGHMAALQLHPWYARLLGMPREMGLLTVRDVGDVAVWRSIKFGFDRAQYLCGVRGYSHTPGGHFMKHMLNYRDWKNDGDGSTAEAFVKEIWPE